MLYIEKEVGASLDDKTVTEENETGLHGVATGVGDDTSGGGKSDVVEPAGVAVCPCRDGRNGQVREVCGDVIPISVKILIITIIRNMMYRTVSGVVWHIIKTGIAFTDTRDGREVREHNHTLMMLTRFVNLTLKPRDSAVVHRIGVCHLRM